MNNAAATRGMASSGAAQRSQQRPGAGGMHTADAACQCQLVSYQALRYAAAWHGAEPDVRYISRVSTASRRSGCGVGPPHCGGPLLTTAALPLRHVLQAAAACIVFHLRVMHLGCRCGCRPIQGRTARCHNRAFVRPVPVGPRLHWPGVSLGRFAGSRRKCNIPIHCQKVQKCICAHGHALASKERPHVPRWRAGGRRHACAFRGAGAGLPALFRRWAPFPHPPPAAAPRLGAWPPRRHSSLFGPAAFEGPWVSRWSLLPLLCSLTSCWARL